LIKADRDDLQFQFASVANGAKNDIICSGQTIDLPDGQYASIRLAGASVFGNQSGTVTVNYSDGTSSNFTLNQVDWMWPTNYPLRIGANRHTSGGGTENAKVYVHYYTVTTPQMVAGKTVTSIKLPANSRMHVMAMTLLK
jgi:hypothetical protein